MKKGRLKLREAVGVACYLYGLVMCYGGKSDKEVPTYDLLLSPVRFLNN